MRIVLAMLSMLAAAPVWAEWVDVAQTVSIVVYMDPATLSKESSHRKAWVLYDFRKRADSGISGLSAMRMRPEGRFRNHMIRQPKIGCSSADNPEAAR